jgi:hypothetical protein
MTPQRAMTKSLTRFSTVQPFNNNRLSGLTRTVIQGQFNPTSVLNQSRIVGKSFQTIIKIGFNLS